MEQNKVLAVVIYKTTNGNYRFEIGEPIKLRRGGNVHPLLAGVSDLKIGLEKLSELYKNHQLLISDSCKIAEELAEHIEKYGSFSASMVPKKTS